MIDQAAVQTSLLELWERGEGERAGRRGLRLLAAAAPGPDADALAHVPIGRRDGLLLDLRERLFGRAFTGVTSCPSCAEDIELSFDVSEVRRATSDVHGATIAIGGVDVRFRLPTAGDAVAIETAPDVAAARATLLDRCVEEARRGDVPLPVREVPTAIVDAAVARMRELDPQADVDLVVECPSCAHRWREPFDIVSFLWAEVAAGARRLLTDVHALASAYGWTEPDILRLTPARRDAYLEMLR